MSEYPSTWRVAALGDVVNRITSGGTPKADNPLFYGGDIPFLKIDDITASSKYLRCHKNTITELGLLESSAKIVPPGTLLLTMYGTIGECCITTYPVATNQAIACFLDHPEIDLNYLYYCLSAKSREFSSASSQTTQANISATILKQTSIAIPPLPEQKKIADALSSIDLTIQNILEKKNKFEHLRGAITLEFLNELSLCQQKPLEQCCKRVCVGFVGTCEPFYRPSGIPLIRTGNLKKGMLDTRDVKYVTRDFHEKQKKSQLHPGDLVIARHGDFGSACIVPDDLLEANCLNVVIIKPDRQLLLPEYLKILLNSTSMKSRFNSKAEGSTQKVISTTEIARSSIPIPPASKQAEIARVISSIEASIARLESQQKSLMSLKASVSQDLLSGRKRVSV